MPPSIDSLLPDVEHALMDSTTLQVELPDSLRSYVDERVRTGDYPDAGAYFRDLVQRDHAAHAGRRLRELIQEGLDSGPARELTDADWAELRMRALRPVS